MSGISLTPVSFLSAKLAHNFQPSDPSPACSLSFDYKFRNEISYSLRAILSSAIQTAYFYDRASSLRGTCKYLRRSSRVAHRPFRLTMCTSRSSSYVLPSLAVEKTVGPSSLSRRIHVRERRYALLRRPALREAFGNISSPAWGTTVPLSFLPRCSLLEVMRSRCDKGSSWVFTQPRETTLDDTERYNFVYPKS